MSELPLTGGCLCGGVRFEVSEPLVSASYCHCTRCQRRTGTAASAQGRLAPDSFQPPDGFAKEFCSTCGSALWSRSPEGEIAAVRLGAFDRDPGIRPQWRQF